jgi:hypothetical protein
VLVVFERRPRGFRPQAVNVVDETPQLGVPIDLGFERRLGLACGVADTAKDLAVRASALI